MRARRDTLLIVSMVGISALGDFLALIPLMVRLQETGSGLLVSALLIALWGPIVALSPVAGLVADRFENRRVIIVVSLAQAVVAVALALTIDSVAAILALAALLGTGFAIAQPAEFALVPVIAGEDRLAVVNGWVETARYAGLGAGPLLGGLLVAGAGLEAAMFVNAGTFVVAAGLAVALRSRRHPRSGDAGEEGRMRLRDGFTLLFRERGLGIVMFAALTSLLFMSASIPADVFFVREDLDQGAGALGSVYTVWTVGMIGSSLLLARRVRPGAVALVALLAVAIQGSGKLIPPLFPAFGVMLVFYFVGGVGHGLKNVLVRTLVQQRVPREAHGRAFAAYNGLRNGAELGALAIGGALVTAIGGGATLALAGGLSALVGLVGAVVLRTSRLPTRPVPASPAPLDGSPVPVPEAPPAHRTE